MRWALRDRTGLTVTALHVVAPAPAAVAGTYFGSEMAPYPPPDNGS